MIALAYSVHLCGHRSNIENRVMVMMILLGLNVNPPMVQLYQDRPTFLAYTQYW